MSHETKSLITQRNDYWAQFKSDPSQDNKRQYQLKCNEVNKNIKKNTNYRDIRDSLTYDKWKPEEPEEKIGWTKHRGPQMLTENGKAITSPQAMADKLNRDNISRAAIARREAPHK